MKIKKILLIFYIIFAFNSNLLSDENNKILKANKEAIFWGSGEEVRDFIHISDVMSLFDMILNTRDKFLIINGGTGIRNTVKDIVETIRDSIDPNISTC